MFKLNYRSLLNKSNNNLKRICLSKIPIALILLSTCLIIQACKKDQTELTVINDPIELAKNALNTASKEIHVKLPNIGYRQSLGRKISWAKAIFKKYGDTTAVYAPITLSEEMIIKSGGKTGISVNSISWLIITNVSGNFKYYMVMKVPDQEMKKSDLFKGVIIIDDWFGSKESVYIRKGDKNQAFNNSNGTTTMALQCTTVLYDICAGETGACTHHADTTCKHVDDNYAEDSIEHPWDNPNMGGGDSPDDPNEDKEDSNKDIKDALQNFPCAQSILQQVPSLKDDISVLINKTFGSNAKNNLIFVSEKFKDASLDAEHKPKINFNNGYSFAAGYSVTSTIKISEDVLLHSTKEYIFVTMYHEALHAFLYVEKLRLGDSFRTTYPEISPYYVNNGTSIFDVNKVIWVDKHSDMAEKFYSQLVKSISLYNPNLSLETVEAMASTGIFVTTNNQRTLNLNERDVRNNNQSGTKCP